MKSRSKTMLAVMGLMVVALLAGCTPKAEEPPTGRANGILTMAETSSPSGVFNPLLIADEYNREVTEIMFEALVEMDPSFNITPALAKSWDISDDGKSITFHLRDNVKWHDGEEFTADDVLFSYEFLCQPELSTYYGTFASVIKGYDEMKNGTATHLEGVEVLDPHTVKITTQEVYGDFLTGLANYIRIIPQHIWGSVPPEEVEERTDLLLNPIGTGPFKMTEFSLDDHIVFDRFDDYWGGKSEIEKIIFRVMTSDAMMAAALKGEVDFGRIQDMNPDDLGSYEEAGFTIDKIYLNSTQVMVPNFNHKLLSNVKVRQGLTYAINRRGIVDSLIYGYGNVANQPYREGLFFTADDSEINLYEYNPEKAIQVLTEEAGWTYKDGTMYDPDGEPVKFSLLYPKGNVAREKSAPVIQENLQDIGIEVDLGVMEFPSLTARLEQGDFELALLGQGTNGADYSSFYGKNAPNNRSGYHNPALDELFKEASMHVDPDEQKGYYVEAAKIMNEELPVIYLYHWYEGRFIAPDLKGVQASSITNFYQLVNWRFEK